MYFIKGTQVIELEDVDEKRREILETQGFMAADEVPQAVLDAIAAHEADLDYASRRADITARLLEIDQQKIRPATALAVAQWNDTDPDPEDINRLTQLETEAQRLRSLLKER